MLGLRELYCYSSKDFIFFSVAKTTQETLPHPIFILFFFTSIYRYRYENLVRLHDHIMTWDQVQLQQN